MTNPSFNDVCRCEHQLELHITHLRSKAEQDLNKLLGMAVDLENMYIAMNREENIETKQVYSYLFKVGTNLLTNNTISYRITVNFTVCNLFLYNFL